MADSRFLIITHVPHIYHEGKYYAYSPYVREMNLWLRHVETYVLIAPLLKGKLPSAIDLPYDFNPKSFRSIDQLFFHSPKHLIHSISGGTRAFKYMIEEMKQASHIHLRCPGNVGLIGCIAQIFFPKKKKTAKYAGNWDPKSIQPLSYRLQKYILRSTFLSSNMKALVYGSWPDQTRNILPFFTASYRDEQKVAVNKSFLGNKVRLVFVGVLEQHKSPETAIEVTRILSNQGIPVKLSLCGDGSQKEYLQNLVQKYRLEEKVELKGNVTAEAVQKELSSAHFLVFSSKSEGWPKAVAEAMFWGCIPITTRVSCLADMVGQNNERGYLISNQPEKIVSIISQLQKNPKEFEDKSRKAMEWSRQYTLDYFESEISKLI